MNKISNIKKFTVTQLNNSIKNLIENYYELIQVAGEITQLKKHSSGHIYFSLKDVDSNISVICWRSIVPSIKIDIKEGIKVLISGRVTTYSQQSKYQLIVQKVELEGQGSILQMLEERKKKLLNQGFFDEDKKQKIPPFPKSIGVITSESGAVIKDIIHRISDRYPLELIVFPANVQGSNCLNDILRGLDYFDKNINERKSFVDIIIIARGGGSLEDLMAFNEELLVKKIYEVKIPIISAIGHETDFTLCDLAADIRAPTPSAAAEMAVPQRKELVLRLNDWSVSFRKTFLNIFENKLLNFQLASSKLPDYSEKINNNFQSLDYSGQKIKNLLNVRLQNVKITFYQTIDKFSVNKFDKLIDSARNLILSNFQKIIIFLRQNRLIKKEKLKSLQKQLIILSYKNTLKRGFAVVKSKGKIIQKNEDVKINQKLEIELFCDKILAKKI
ncbi:MAG: exodeoxyribonuclease VII large subunit [Alphaproteobacteria bacterium]|tara:strand:+ start:1580 stop:2914 length:1335 start_codon:yes stop_codon:yes gene_type:complete